MVEKEKEYPWELSINLYNYIWYYILVHSIFFSGFLLSPSVAGHEAPAPFGAMAPFGGSLFGGSDPFQVGTDVVLIAMAILTGAFYVGNGWDWGLLGWLLLVYGSFPHSLLSTSKFLVMANWTPELCRWNPTNFLCWIRGLTAVNGFGPWTRSYRSQSKKPWGHS